MRKTQFLLHFLFFVLTLVTTTLAGVQWLNRSPFELENLTSGLPYSASLLFILIAHELGHYLAARARGIETTYPLFLPFPSFLGILSFGTLGAVIRIRGTIQSKRVLFDIGAAGPITGFLASIGVLILGFATLPGKEYLYNFHPEYAVLTAIPTSGLTFGNPLAYDFLSMFRFSSDGFVPPLNEIYHYPFLCTGWFGLLVTSMNLIPVGQLDGGHISYCMFGSRSRLIARVALVVLSILGLSAFLPLIGIPYQFGWFGWLFWAILLAAFTRFARLPHPSTMDDSTIDTARIIIGACCWLVFIVSFSPAPFSE